MVLQVSCPQAISGLKNKNQHFEFAWKQISSADLAVLEWYNTYIPSLAVLVATFWAAEVLLPFLKAANYSTLTRI